MGEFVLRMTGDGASDGRPNTGDTDFAANRQCTVEPLIFEKARGGRAGIDKDVGAKAARVEIGGAALKIAQMRQGAGGDNMNDVFVEEVAARRQGVTAHD